MSITQIKDLEDTLKVASVNNVLLTFKSIFFSDKINLAILLNKKYWCADEETRSFIFSLAEQEFLDSLEYKKLLFKDENIYLNNPRNQINIDKVKENYHFFRIKEDEFSSYKIKLKEVKNISFGRNYDDEAKYLKYKCIDAEVVENIIDTYFEKISIDVLQNYLKFNSYGFEPFCIFNTLKEKKLQEWM